MLMNVDAMRSADGSHLRISFCGAWPAHADSFAAMRSATMIVVMLVGTDGILRGRIDASTTRSAPEAPHLPPGVDDRRFGIPLRPHRHESMSGCR